MGVGLAITWLPNAKLGPCRAPFGPSVVIHPQGAGRGGVRKVI